MNFYIFSQSYPSLELTVKLTMETQVQCVKSIQILEIPERHHWHCFGVFIVKFG